MENADYIITCNRINIDELLELKKTIDLLLNAGAGVLIFEDDREVSVEFLDNVIESHMDTERFLEEIDQKETESTIGEFLIEEKGQVCPKTEAIHFFRR